MFRSLRDWFGGFDNYCAYCGHDGEMRRIQGSWYHQRCYYAGRAWGLVYRSFIEAAYDSERDNYTYHDYIVMFAMCVISYIPMILFIYGAITMFMMCNTYIMIAISLTAIYWWQVLYSLIYVIVIGIFVAFSRIIAKIFNVRDYDN
jgi:hypothetical protein